MTVDGVTHVLPAPFLLLATENPIEQEGTFPLPEAQLDRFFLRTALGYPGPRARSSRSSRASWPGTRSTPCSRVSRRPRSRALQEAVEEIYVDELLRRWIVELVRATR